MSEEKLAVEEKLKTAEEKLGAVEENLQVKKIIISSYILFLFRFLNALNLIETDGLVRCMDFGVQFTNFCPVVGIL